MVNTSVFHRGIIAVRGPQQHRHERRLPVVAMKRVCRPNMFGDFDRRAAKLRVTLRVVGIIFSTGSVQTFAVKIRGIVNEEIVHSADERAVNDGGKAEPCAAHRNRQARHHHRGRLCPAVERQYHGHLVALRYQSFRQRLHHVR